MFDFVRQWFDFAFENQGKVKPNHTALYLWFVELNNRMGWVENFGSPASQSLIAMGINSHTSYKQTFDDLVKWGFVIVISESKNQYQSNIIALNNIDKAPLKALDKALAKHSTKHSTKHGDYNKTTDYKQQTIDVDDIQTVESSKKPTLEMFVKYFGENGYTPEHARFVFEYYDCADWKDRNGNKVKNWKQKSRGVWFKNEGKIPKAVSTSNDGIMYHTPQTEFCTYEQYLTNCMVYKLTPQPKNESLFP